MTDNLTRRQRDILRYLAGHADHAPHPPTLDALCEALGLRSRGSLHKHVQALITAGLVEPMDGKRRGVRLARPPDGSASVPFLGYIAAGRPIEAVENPELFSLPEALHTGRPCYVLRVKGDSMIEEGILDGDWIMVESRDHARDGEIVVALVDGRDATLKRIEQRPGKVILHPANSAMAPLELDPERVQVQGVLAGLIRKYR